MLSSHDNVSELYAIALLPFTKQYRNYLHSSTTVDMLNTRLVLESGSCLIQID